MLKMTVTALLITTGLAVPSANAFGSTPPWSTPGDWPVDGAFENKKRETVQNPNIVSTREAQPTSVRPDSQRGEARVR